jgi:hypothetical protein
MLLTGHHVKCHVAVSVGVLAWACGRAGLVTTSDSETGPETPSTAVGEGGALSESDAALKDEPDATSPGQSDAPSNVVTQKCAASPTQLAHSPQVDGAIELAMDLAVNSSDVVYAINGGSASINGVAISGASAYVFRVPIRGGSPVLLSTLDGQESAMLLGGSCEFQVPGDFQSYSRQNSGNLAWRSTTSAFIGAAQRWAYSVSPRQTRRLWEPRPRTIRGLARASAVRPAPPFAIRLFRAQV